MIRIIAPLVVVAALLAGCGDADPTQFTDRFEEVLRPVESAAVGGSDPEKVKRLAEAFDQAADRLSKLDAPDGTEDEVAQVVAKLHQGAALYRDASTALAGDSEAEMERVRARATAYHASFDDIGRALGRAIDAVSS